MTHHTKATQDEESVHFYPEEELVELVHSLDREEDQHLFAQDVLISYPYLAEEYHKVCPHRMDLHSAAERASHGDYSYDAKLTELRHDIDLMVNNCVRFNGESHPLSEIAESFQFFAHEALDAYIASKTGGRRVSLLRLQLSQHSPTAATTINNTNSVNVDVHKTIKPVKPTTLPSCAELMEFISHTLVRREDANAFVEDVTVAYPSLKESYEAICPVKMNLMMMRERAQDGYYTYESIKDTESMCKEMEETITDKNNYVYKENNNEVHKHSIQDAKEHKNESSYKSASKENNNSSRSSKDNNNKSKKESSQVSSDKEKNLDIKSNIVHKSVNEEMYKEWRMHKVFGVSVATSLHRLREDLELIVDNCIRFNINVEAWVKLALSFRKFAHRKVDELVLRHAPVLKGTTTGVDVYVKQIHALQQQLLEKNQTTSNNALQTMSSNIHQDSVLFSAQKAANAEVQEKEEEQNNYSNITAGQTKENTAKVTHHAQNNSSLISPSLEETEEDEKGIKKEEEDMNQDDKNKLKRPRDEREEPNFTADKVNNTTIKHIHYGNSNSATVKSHKPNAIPSVHVVHMTTPHITPSALQPEVHIPASLRMQIEYDYVKRDTIRLRRIGSMLPLTEELVSICNTSEIIEYKNNENESTQNSTKEANNDSKNDDQNAEPATNSKEETITKITTNNNNNDNNSKIKKEVVVTTQMTSAFVLHLFMESVHDYYHHRRTEPSFNTAFDYSAQDEQLYDDVIHVLATQFDQLFTSLLLYPLELADAHAWQAVQLWKQTNHIITPANQNNIEEEVNSTSIKVFSWLEEVHYSYLVRFLVQFPQLACLICAQSASASTMLSSSSTTHTNKPSLSNKRNQPAPHMKNSTLQISRDVLVLLQRITKIVNECLQFIADYEQKLQVQVNEAAECLNDKVEQPEFLSKTLEHEQQIELEHY